MDTDQKTVLVVEDEEPLRKILIQQMQQAGYKTLSAPDGGEGISIALTKRPDLILLDIIMPHSGLEMFEKLRADEGYGKSVPVILLTNLNPEGETILQAVDKFEPAYYLIKSNVTPVHIVEKVREILTDR